MSWSPCSTGDKLAQSSGRRYLAGTPARALRQARRAAASWPGAGHVHPGWKLAQTDSPGINAEKTVNRYE